MLRLASKLRPPAAIFALILLAPGGQQAFAAQGPSLASLRIAGAAEIQDVFIRAPRNVSSSEPLQVLIALHGMGGNGADFGGALASQADAQGWLIVAPTWRMCTVYHVPTRNFGYASVTRNRWFPG